MQDAGASASQQLQQARQQAETLLFTLQVCLHLIQLSYVFADRSWLWAEASTSDGNGTS